jgi:hypothetical protein
MRAATRAHNARFVALVGVVVAAAGCPSRPPAEPAPRPGVRVRSFTEATAVHHILAVPPFAFAATGAGIDRWDLRSGQAVHLGSEHGLPGERVQALDFDPGHRELWIATDAGLTRYDLDEAAFRDVPPPPSVLGIDSFAGAVLAAARGGGTWIGLRRGLYRVSREGVWAPTGITSPVTSLLVDGDAALWIGTTVGLFVSRAGIATPLGPERGCDLASVRFVAVGPDGRVVAVGENAARRQRIAVAAGDGCHSYRVSPDQIWLAAASRPDELLVLTDNRLYSVKRWSAVGRSLVRDGMQLMPVPRPDGERPAPSPYVLQAQGGALPDGSQVLAAAGSEVLVGTRTLGTARVAAAGRGPVQWLRRGELVEQATGLTVACAAREDCYIATGSRRAWRFDGRRFTPTGGGERRVLAVARAPDGRLFGMRQGPDPRRIGLAEITRGEWRDLGLAIETPGRDPELGFARFSPSGLLWLGLRYRDPAGELRPYGVALVDLALGVVAYHHASDDAREEQKGVLSIPIDVTGVDFLGEDEVWLATSQGAAQVVGRKVVVYGEAEGLRSEIMHGVACTGGGLVYLAAGHGVAAFDGDRWQYPRPLAISADDIEIGPDGRLWMATERGLAVYDGARLRRLDARRGLVENRIRDVALDHYGRVWLRGSQSLGIVTP